MSRLKCICLKRIAWYLRTDVSVGYFNENPIETTIYILRAGERVFARLKCVVSLSNKRPVVIMAQSVNDALDVYIKVKMRKRVSQKAGGHAHKSYYTLKLWY